MKLILKPKKKLQSNIKCYKENCKEQATALFYGRSYCSQHFYERREEERYKRKQQKDKEKKENEQGGIIKYDYNNILDIRNNDSTL